MANISGVVKSDMEALRRGMHEAGQLWASEMAYQHIAARDALFGVSNYKSRNTPCKYCGRTRQEHNHRTCDGCGAVKP